jgi:hypothetical protein
MGDYAIALNYDDGKDDIEDSLTVASQQGDFIPAPDIKGSPVSHEQVIENMRDSFEFKFPVLEPHKGIRREGSFIFVAGGTTLLGFIDELKDRYEHGEFICTSNHTNDFLIDNGIIPTMLLILDPKKICGGYIKKPNNQTLFVVATSCHKSVIDGLVEKGITNIKKLLIGYGLADGEDIRVQKELYSQNGDYYNIGGTMTPLRAMTLSLMLGFNTIEYYGFDSCFANTEPKLVMESDPKYEEIKASLGGAYFNDPKKNINYVLDGVSQGGFFYAYGKKRAENIQVAMTADGRRFLTCPAFAHQAKQFKKWVDRLEDKLTVIVHGDSLTSHIYKLHQMKKTKEYAGIRDRRWTDKYKQLQIQFHADTKYRYGFRGGEDSDNLELIGRGIVGLYDKTDLPIRILDYGCGEANLERVLNRYFKEVEVTNYDPFIEEYSTEPEGMYDVTACLDVLEHVEEQCIENTLKFIRDKTKFMVLFSFSTGDSIKTLPDGRNAHITQRGLAWWKDRLLKYFVILEGYSDGLYVNLMCQTQNASQYVKTKQKISQEVVCENADVVATAV